MDGALDVAVVGVANIDLMTRVPKLARDGETAFGTPLETRAGGKGLNQAVAVVKHGGRAALAGQAGDDPWGHLLRNALVASGVETTAFALVPGGSTAAVLIQVPASGDSAVTVTRTATTMHTIEDIDRARGVLHAAAVTIVQLELDPRVIDAALNATHGLKIGMLAPLQPLPARLLSALDLLVVNEAEARTILGLDAADGDGLLLATALVRCGPQAAVVTLGAQGAAYADNSCANLVAARPANVRDTTGAGDAFLGALALSMARGAALRDAVRAGNHAGGDAVAR